jgi:hypothetical protein
MERNQYTRRGINKNIPEDPGTDPNADLASATGGCFLFLHGQSTLHKVGILSQGKMDVLIKGVRTTG